jgi:hypothetical protein
MSGIAVNYMVLRALLEGDQRLSQVAKLYDSFQDGGNDSHQGKKLDH